MAIQFLSNIAMGHQLPDVERQLHEDIEHLKNWNENYLPDVYEANLKSDGSRWRYIRSNEFIDPATDTAAGRWRKVEGGSADLSSYYTKDDVDGLLDDKVDKEDGKGLSTNDFSDTYKDKIGTENLTTTAQDLSSAVNEVKDKTDNLQTAVDDLQDDLAALNKDPAKVVDEKPIYNDQVEPHTITYKQRGQSYTIDYEPMWFYYDDDAGDHVQTIWLDGRELTIASVGVNLEEYVKKDTDIVDDLTNTDTDKALSANQGKVLSDALADKLDIDHGVENANKKVVTDETGKIVLVAGGTGDASDADNVNYTNPNHQDWDNVQKALDGIIDKIEYVKPAISSFSMSPSTTEYEVGQHVTNLTFNWSYNKTIKTQTLTDCSLDDATIRTATWSGDISTNKTFTLSASDGQNSASSSKSIAFKNKIYWGSAAEGAYDSGFILALSDKKFATDYKGRFSMTVASGEYGYIACPQSWNIPAEATIGGFVTDLTKAATISFTNASGGTVTYDILRTGRKGLGSLEMEFK